MSEETQERERDLWRHISGVLVLVQTLALIASVYLLREQIKDLENTKSNRSADLIFRFDERFDKPPYSSSGSPLKATNRSQRSMAARLGRTAHGIRGRSLLS